MSKAQTFEEKLARLTVIVAKLEGGALSLDESLKLFAEGNELSKALTSELNEAKLKIEGIDAK